MRLSPQLTLNNGVLIDRLGFGLYKVPPADAASLVTMAIEAGYRHFDTAAMYGNETGVGKGIGALSGFEGTGGELRRNRTVRLARGPLRHHQGLE